MEPMDYEMDNDLDSPREPHTGLPRGTQCPYLRETVYGGNPPTRTPAWPQASPYSQPPSTAQTSPYYPPYPAFPAYDPSFDYASQYGHHHPPGSYGAQRAIFTRHRPHPAGQNQPNTRPGAIAHPPAPQPTTYGSLAPTLAPMSPQQQAYEAMRQQQQHQQQQQHHHHPHHPQQQQHQRNIPFNQQPTSPPYYLTPAYHGGSPYPQQPQQHQTEPPRTIAAWTSGGQTSFAGTRQSRQAPDFSSIYYNEFGYVHPIARQSAYMASPSNTAASDAHAPRPGPITTTATSEGIPNPTLTPAEPPAVTQTQEGPASRPRTLGYTGPPSRPTQAEDTMQIDSDDSDNSESHILANMSTLPFGFRPSAAQDYLASGYFEQNIVNSRENEGIADPGRPLRDFNAFLNGEGGRLSPTESFDESLGGRTPRRRRNATTTVTTATVLSAAATTQVTASGDDAESQLQRRARIMESHRQRQMVHHARRLQQDMLMHRDYGNGPRRATTKFIETLPRVDVDSLTEEDQSCPICMERYCEPEPIEGKIEKPVKLPCGHIYGNNCIKTWLKEHCTCPSCRRKVESEPVPSSAARIAAERRYLARRHPRSGQSGEEYLAPALFPLSGGSPSVDPGMDRRAEITAHLSAQMHAYQQRVALRHGSQRPNRQPATMGLASPQTPPHHDSRQTRHAMSSYGQLPSPSSAMRRPQSTSLQDIASIMQYGSSPVRQSINESRSNAGSVPSLDAFSQANSNVRSITPALPLPQLEGPRREQPAQSHPTQGNEQGALVQSSSWSSSPS